MLTLCGIDATKERLDRCSYVGEGAELLPTATQSGAGGFPPRGRSLIRTAFMLSDLAAGVTCEITHVDAGFSTVIPGME